MDKSPAPSPIDQIGNLLREVSGLVLVIVAYLVALTGQSPGPLPQTTAVFTVVVTTVLLWIWRWPQITRQEAAAESKVLVVGTIPNEPQLRTFKDRLFDLFCSSSVRSYKLSVTRRRTEAGVLTILSLATVFWTGFALPKVIPEITSAFSPVSLPMTCIGSKEPDALRVIIVDFDEVGPQPQFLLEDRLFDDLSERLEGDMAICRLQQVVSLRSEALALGERTQAAIIVWGRSDVVFEAHIEVAGWDLPGRDLPPLPSEDVAKSTFVIREQIHLGFLTEFTFSEILYLDNQIERAQQVLNEALTRAEQQGLSEDNAADMAEAYYLQGFLSKESPKPDFQQAVVAYSKAFELDPTFYAAILNRGEVYRQLGEDENARADYELLIEEHTSLASSAYINLALLVTESDQGAAERYFVSAIKLNPLEGYWYRGNVRLYKWNDPEGAVDDFNEAVKLKPGAYFFYHSLGQAQLIAGQTDNAIETYQEIIVYLDEDARQEVIKELKALSQQRPHLNESITGIIRSLQEATLP